MTHHCLVRKEFPYTFPEGLHHFTVPPSNSAQRFQFLHILVVTCLFSVFLIINFKTLFIYFFAAESLLLCSGSL